MTEQNIDLKSLYELFKNNPDLDIEIETPNGYQKIKSVDITAKDSETITIEFDDNSVTSSENHYFKTDSGDGTKVYTSALNVLKNNTPVLTRNGLKTPKTVYVNNEKIDLYDIQVEGNPEFFVNDEIISHNSNILNSITYGLQGRTLDTIDRESNRDNKFINFNRNLDYCQVKIFISVEGKQYCITRRTERKWDRKKTSITSCSTTVKYDLVDELGNILNQETDQDKNKTQEYLKNIVGEFKDFLRLSLINADNLNDILSMDRAEFLTAILKDSGLDMFEKKLERFKKWKKDEYKKETQLKIDVLDYQNQIETHKLNIIEYEKEIQTIESEIKNLDDSLSKGNSYRDEVLSTKKDVDLVLLNTNVNDIKTNILNLIEKKKNKEHEIETLKEKIAGLEKYVFNKESYDLVLNEFNTFKDLMSNKKHEIKKIQLENEQLLNDISKTNGLISLEERNIKFLDNELEAEIKRIQSQIEIKEKEIAQFENSKVCPTCKQLKNKDAISEIEKTIRNIRLNINGLEHEISSLKFNFNYKDKLDKINNQITQYQTKITEYNSEIEKNKEKISIIEAEIIKKQLDFETINHKLHEFDNIKEKINEKNLLIKDLENKPTDIENIELRIDLENKRITDYERNLQNKEENDKIDIKLQKIDARINELLTQKNSKNERRLSLKNTYIVNEQQSIKQKNETIEKFEKQQNEELIRDFYEKILHREGLPSLILKQRLFTINNVLSEYLIDVDFDVYLNDDLEFKMIKKYAPDILMDVKSGSGMERVFSSIALRLALRMLNRNSKPNILLLDELFGKLSEKNAGLFVGLMRQLRRYIDKVIIIEHAHSELIEPDFLLVAEKDLDNNTKLTFK